jgi:hypothetical protein
MSDDAIKKVFDKFEQTLFLADAKYQDKVITALERQREINLARAEAAQQIRQYIDKEIIGEDEPFSMHGGQSWEFKNQVRAEQRKKLREPME